MTPSAVSYTRRQILVTLKPEGGSRAPAHAPVIAARLT
jgi:hypothetical protein